MTWAFFSAFGKLFTLIVVLLECLLYQQIREPWFVKLRQYIPDFYVKTKQEKLICIFSCEIIPVIRLSAKICSDILKERRKLLYK